MAQTFDNYFVSVERSLKIKYNKDFLTDTETASQEDLIQVIIGKFKNYFSVFIIKNKNSKTVSLIFALVTKDYIASSSKNIDGSETDQKDNAHWKQESLKRTVIFFSDTLHRNINKCISESIFPNI